LGRAMTAPLSSTATEVLRALILGMELRRQAIGWEFVESWQEPKSSNIDDSILSELLEAKTIRVVDDRAALTELGREYLSTITQTLLRHIVKWRNGND
jgi:hypothetical protein